MIAVLGANMANLGIRVGDVEMGSSAYMGEMLIRVTLTDRDVIDDTVELTFELEAFRKFIAMADSYAADVEAVNQQIKDEG